MFRITRSEIVTTLAMAVLLAPAARAQTDAVKKQLLSATERGKMFEKQGKLDQAAREYKQGGELAQRAFGSDHLYVAQSLNKLANLYADMGRYADAEPLYKRSLDIREQQVGRDHSDVAESLNNLAILYREMGRY